MTHLFSCPRPEAPGRLGPDRLAHRVMFADAAHGRSAEAEHREILRASLAPKPPRRPLSEARKGFKANSGVRDFLGAADAEASYLAAIALIHDLTVVTPNVADFTGTGVNLLNPFSVSPRLTS